MRGSVLADFTRNVQRSVERVGMANDDLVGSLARMNNATLQRSSVTEVVIPDTDTLEVAKLYREATETILDAYESLQQTRGQLARAIADVRAACDSLVATADGAARAALDRLPPDVWGAEDPAMASTSNRRRLSLLLRSVDRMQDFSGELCSMYEGHLAMAHVCTLRALPASCVEAWGGRCGVLGREGDEPQQERRLLHRQRRQEEGPELASSGSPALGVLPERVPSVYRLPAASEDDREHLTVLTAAVMTSPLVDASRVAALLDGLQAISEEVDRQHATPVAH